METVAQCCVLHATQLEVWDLYECRFLIVFIYYFWALSFHEHTSTAARDSGSSKGNSLQCVRRQEVWGVEEWGGGPVGKSLPWCRMLSRTCSGEDWHLRQSFPTSKQQ